MVRSVPLGFLGFEISPDERGNREARAARGRQGGLRLSPGKLGWRARPESGYRRDPSYPLREVPPFSRRQSGTGGPGLRSTWSICANECHDRHLANDRDTLGELMKRRSSSLLAEYFWPIPAGC
jgi:hypothetical protein